MDYLNANFAIPGIVEFSEGDGEIPFAVLVHPLTGQRCAIYLHGAAITEWILPNAQRVLREEVVEGFDTEKPIRCDLQYAVPDVHARMGLGTLWM